MFWKNIVGTLADDWRYNVKPKLIDGFRNPDPGIVTMAVLTTLQTQREKNLAALHPVPRPQTNEARVAAAHPKPTAKKKVSPTAVERGRICVQIKAEMKQILYMTREGGKNITEIRHEKPAFRFWKLVGELSEEDRYTALHPNQWGRGYPPLLLSKYFAVSQFRIRDYITEANRADGNKKRRAH